MPQTKELRKQYYQKNKEKWREWYLDNKEHRQQYMDKYRKDNKEIIAQQVKGYREKYLQTPENRLKYIKRIVKGVKKRREEIKYRLNQYLGGKCKKCGYSKCVEALDFHHRNPEEKKYGICTLISNKGFSYEKIKEEIVKCDLLCANCHREEHYHLKQMVKKDELEKETVQQNNGWFTDKGN